MFASWKAQLIAIAAGIGAVAYVALRIFGMGRSAERADAIVKGEKQKDEFHDSINAGHAAGGNRDGLLPVEQDPRNRANRS